MGLLGDGGFSLPIASEIEVIQASIEVTEAAAKAMVEAIGEDANTHALVVSADAGGCSGFMYDMKIVNRPEGDEWQVVHDDGFKVMIHDRDSSRLNGIRIDHRESLMGGGFQIENPNAERGCGCGKSFG